MKNVTIDSKQLDDLIEHLEHTIDIFADKDCLTYMAKYGIFREVLVNKTRYFQDRLISAKNGFYTE